MFLVLLLAVLSQTLASPSTPNSRITTLTECYKKGRQIDCAWNPQVVQNDGYARVCEPTQSFLGSVGKNSTGEEEGEECKLNMGNNYTCRFDSYSTCAPRSETQCIDPPLWLIFQKTRQMLNTSSTLTALRVNQTISQVLDKSLQCTSNLFNTTCLLDEQCVWTPNEYNPSTPVQFSATKETIQFVQPATAFAAPAAAADVKRVRIESTNKADHVNVITLTVRNNTVGFEFQLEYQNVTTRMLNYYMSPSALRTRLEELLQQQQPVTVAATQINFNDSQRSWVIRGENVQQLQVVIPPVSITKEEETIAGDTPPSQVIITRHARTVQSVQIVTSNGVSVGNGYFMIECVGVARSSSIAYNAGAKDFALALADMRDSDQTPVFDFVAVTKPASGMWVVEFTAKVAEYEPNDLQLTPTEVNLLTSSNMPCACQVQVYFNVTSPVLPSKGYTVKFLFADLNRLVGGNGALFKTSNNILIATTATPAATINFTNPCLRYRGNYYTMVNYTNNSTIQVLEHEIWSPTANSTYSITADMRRDYGYGVFPCIDYPLADLSNLRVNATDALFIAARAAAEWISDVALEWESAPNPYGEFTALVNLTAYEGVVPKLYFPSSLVQSSAASKTMSIKVETLSAGRAPVLSGRFRMYMFLNSTTSSLEQTRLLQQAKAVAVSSTTFGKITNTGALVLNSAELPDISSRLVFTKEISVSGVEAELLPALVEALPYEISVQVDYLASTKRAKLVFTHPKHISQIPLVVFTEDGMLGSSASLLVEMDKPAMSSPAQDELDKLLDAYGPFERAAHQLSSPCRMNPAMRRASVVQAWGDYLAVERLDERAMLCSMLGGSRESACVGPKAVEYGCVWRGNTTTYSFESVDRETIYSVWRSRDFSWGNNSFALHSNCTVDLVYTIRTLSDMLVPLSKAIGPVSANSTKIKLNGTDLLLVDETLLLDGNTSVVQANIQPAQLVGVAIEFLALHSEVSNQVSKFEKCLTNPTYRTTYSQTAFVDVWSTIFRYTGITCGLFYALAGALLAYRMDKFKLMGFKFRDAMGGVLIVICSSAVGAVMGFAMGAIPSALVSQMYASVPVQLSDEWAVSLGVAQGLLIIYFDMGRGGAGAELAFRNGE